jgi:hypothetical protein
MARGIINHETQEKTPKNFRNGLLDDWIDERAAQPIYPIIHPSIHPLQIR